MARPNVVRSQPFSASIGSWKKPIAERGPKVSAAMAQPQMMISHGTAFLAGVEALACAVMYAISGQALSYPIIRSA